jgi:hypothetical protein
MIRAPLLALLLSGCVPGITGSTYTDGRFWYSNVKSGSDIAGGPRQDVVVIVDRDGTLVGKLDAAGVGTLQAVASGLSAAVVTAGGVVAGNALIRPARNTTNVRMDVQGTGGSGGAGGSNTVSGTSSSTGSTATGGAATSSSISTGVPQ